MIPVDDKKKNRFWAYGPKPVTLGAGGRGTDPTDEELAVGWFEALPVKTTKKDIGDPNCREGRHKGKCMDDDGDFWTLGKFFCEVCDDGYFRSDEGICEPCETDDDGNQCQECIDTNQCTKCDKNSILVLSKNDPKEGHTNCVYSKGRPAAKVLNELLPDT